MGMTPPADTLQLEHALAVLERTPSALTVMLAGLPDFWVRATEGAGTWSPHDVVGHLVHGERTDWMPRTRHILAGDPAPFAPFDRAGHLHDGERTLDELLAAFTALRRRNVAELREMRVTPADLGRTGVHPAFGEVTLSQLLATWVVHDLDHTAQIARTMAKVYATAVGPWTEYLSILHDRRAR